MLRRLAIVASFSLLTASTAAAQGLFLGWVALSGAAVVQLVKAAHADVTVGANVQVRGARGSDLSGVVRAIDRDSFEVAFGAKETRFANNELVDVTVSTRRSQWAQGWGTGLLIGAGTGAIIGLIAGDDAWFSQSEMVLIGAIGVGMIGSTIGALIGVAQTKEKWVKASKTQMPVSIMPVGKGIGVTASLRF